MTKDCLWYPYSQHLTMPLPLEVVSAKGVGLTLKNGKVLIDGISSWWCVIHGYNHPELNRALIAQSELFSHIMLGGLTHAPALSLAQKLIEITPAGLDYVFFSDSGSVGVEVSLKMALGYWHRLGLPKKNKFITLQYAYHGDTFGAMSVCDPIDSMHAQYSDLVAQQFLIPSPCDDLQKSIEALTHLLEAQHHVIAAFIVEPLVQGAGGMKFYSPDFLKQARRLCTKYNVLLIFDEVATGFGRTGRWFAADHADVSPDIMVVGKGLTGGVLGLAATLATDSIYSAFLSLRTEDALMHGPTFMGNALACAVALKSIELLEKDPNFLRIKLIEALCIQVLEPLRLYDSIKDVRVFGAIAVVEVRDPSVLEGLQDFAILRGVWIRPFGNVVYLMPAFSISEDELKQVLSTILGWFDTFE